MTLSRCKVTTRKTGKSLKISFQLSAICWWVFGWSYCSDLLFFSVKRQDIVLMRWVSPHVNQLDPTWSSKQLNQLDLVDLPCCDSRGLYDAVIGFLPDQLSNLLGPVRHAPEKNNFMPDPNSARSVTMLEETMQPIYLLPVWNLSPALGWQSILA